MSEINVDTITCDKLVVNKEVIVKNGDNTVIIAVNKDGCGIHLQHKDNLIGIYSYDHQGPVIGLTKDGLKTSSGYQLALYIDKDKERIQINKDGKVTHINLEDIKTP